MTVLSEYDRLEAIGLWRETQGAQRRETVVSLGDATLVMTDQHERPLAHWSLPAIERLNPDEMPALYAPGIDADETLELDDDAMIAAIEKVRTTLARRRIRPGRLRVFVILGLLLAMAALAYFRVPGTLTTYTLRVVPAAKRAEIGNAILVQIARSAGQPCTTPPGKRALAQLHKRLLPATSGSLVVVPSGIATTAYLPGGTIIIARKLVEDFDEPDVVAGYIVAEDARQTGKDPLRAVLDNAGFVATFRLYTTGQLPKAAIRDYAQTVLNQTNPPVATPVLLSRFRDADLRTTPYAYALDATGETTLPLIEADPLAIGNTRPILPDGTWVSLQGICSA